MIHVYMFQHTKQKVYLQNMATTDVSVDASVCVCVCVHCSMREVP